MRRHRAGMKSFWAHASILLRTGLGLFFRPGAWIFVSNRLTRTTISYLQSFWVNIFQLEGNWKQWDIKGDTWTCSCLAELWIWIPTRPGIICRACPRDLLPNICNTTLRLVAGRVCHHSTSDTTYRPRWNRPPLPIENPPGVNWHKQNLSLTSRVHLDFVNNHRWYRIKI